jgi:RNA polymerase sigma-70 factor (ECF subfamily)
VSLAEEITVFIPRLRRYALALTGSRAQAEDLVQDTLERALSRFHLWRRGSNLRAWLFTIMHNLHANYVRGHQLEQKVAFEESLLELPAKAAQEERIEIRDLENALQKLPSEQREVLLLVALEEMSYREVAKVLDIPVGTVMSRLARARQRLRGLMRGGSGTAQLKVVK